MTCQDVPLPTWTANPKPYTLNPTPKTLNLIRQP
jgi:hypothetical protein